LISSEFKRNLSNREQQHLQGPMPISSHGPAAQSTSRVVPSARLAPPDFAKRHMADERGGQAREAGRKKRVASCEGFEEAGELPLRRKMAVSREFEEGVAKEGLRLGIDGVACTAEARGVPECSKVSGDGVDNENAASASVWELLKSLPGYTGDGGHFMDGEFSEQALGHYNEVLDTGFEELSIPSFDYAMDQSTPSHHHILSKEKCADTVPVHENGPSKASEIYVSESLHAGPRIVESARHVRPKAVPDSGKVAWNEPCDCPVFGKLVSRRFDLARHIETAHGEARTYGCDHCEKTFKLPHHLKAHGNSFHTETKLRQCNKCNFETKIKSDYLDHKTAAHSKK